MSEWPKLAFVNDAHVVVAALGGQMDPLRKVKLFVQRGNEDELLGEFIFGKGNVLRAWSLNDSPDADIFEDLTQIKRMLLRALCPAGRVPLAAGTEPASQRR